MEPVTMLAHANAVLNMIAATAIWAAYQQIRTGNRSAHRRYMLIGIAASAVFLVFYLIYHSMVGYLPFQGSGWVRPIYFTILATHVVLAAVITLLVPVTAFFAFSGLLGSHRQLARWTLPIWMYVSVSGIVVYAMVYWIPW
jgi:uncharacterized membrane protein YozB (DUF420 family)